LRIENTGWRGKLDIHQRGEDSFSGPVALKPGTAKKEFDEGKNRKTQVRTSLERTFQIKWFEGNTKPWGRRRKGNRRGGCGIRRAKTSTQTRQRGVKIMNHSPRKIEIEGEKRTELEPTPGRAD